MTLAFMASQNWLLTQLDINNAFLNGDLFEEVYIELPLGYHSQNGHLHVMTELGNKVRGV